MFTARKLRMTDLQVATRELTRVKKRDGSIVPFNRERMISAVLRAMEAAREGQRFNAEAVADKVVDRLQDSKTNGIPTVEEIQDAVETILMKDEYLRTAKHFILYRDEHRRIREQKPEIPHDVKQLVKHSKNLFENPLGEFVYYRSYSRWIEDKGRRETWIETVDRYMEYMAINLGDKLTDDEYEEIKEYILKMWSLPSMRLMWAAGDAADNTNVCAYNCSYIAIQELQDFAEIVYLLMCGTGVGYSCESYSVQKLPIIQFQEDDGLAELHVVEDSKEGWANALEKLLGITYCGHKVVFDFDKVRPAGSKLKTMGGKSSGPQPLIDLLNYTEAKILSKQGSRLSEIDVHDIVCKIGEIVVMGGVRRTALISLSDLHSNDMRYAKRGHFFINEPQRQRANNSAAYNTKPTQEEFLSEWLALVQSRSGERGIFNRGSLQQQIPSRRLHTISDGLLTVGTNPCGEIILQSKQFCNLTEVIARAGDTQKSILAKVRIATILGTYQSMLTNFRYLSPQWKENCEAERLLGVSITGQWDCPEVRKTETLRWAKAVAVKTNKEYAERFGINASASITCVKPSGTVSQLTNTSSGMHARHAEYYIRRIRISATDALFQMLKDQGWPYAPEVGESMDSATTYVLEFPVASPHGSVLRKDLTALDQLEYWKKVKEQYTEHNPSCTISVGDDEWIDVAYWVWNNWDIIGGLSFLPREDHVYALAPYEEITKDKYEQLIQELPDVDFSQILAYEKEDNTEGSKELACVGDLCEI